MCGSMVDIQSADAEIRRGKKKEEKTTGQGGHNKFGLSLVKTVIH